MPVGHGVKVRPYDEADESAVIALWQACGLTRPWNDPRRDIERKLSVQRDLFIVGTADDSPDAPIIASAMAGYDGHRGWVNYLAVAPDQQRRGLGEALMRHLEQSLGALGCPKLNLQVRAGNDAAIAFYRRLGYLPDEALSFGKRLIPDTPPG